MGDAIRPILIIHRNAMDFDLATGLAVLRRTPDTLRTMLSGLPEAWTEGNEGPETWSPYEVVGHLIHGERTVWPVRARTILEQGADRRFRPFVRTPVRDPEKSLGDLLAEFAAVRAESIATIEGWQLTDETLALEGIHPEFGTVTLRQLLATWVAHDLGHIAQISRVMAKQYRDAVGPWRAYLSIMGR
jgi:hypothetical protein